MNARVCALLLACAALAACSSDSSSRVGEGTAPEPPTPMDPNARHYLFTSFRGNGESGLHLALSTDLYNWTELNHGGSFLDERRWLRDVHAAKGPDNAYHLVWTTGDPRSIGYAKTFDFIHYVDIRDLPVMVSEPECEHSWAPEIVWLPRRKEWMIHWSSKITGRHLDTSHPKNAEFHDRIYACTTKDFRTLSEPGLLFDPGYSVLDSNILLADGRWVMIFKDQRRHPDMIRLRATTAPMPFGPWGEPSRPFAPRSSEAPSAVRTEQGWMVFYDVYNEGHYGAVVSKDLTSFYPVTHRLDFPKDHSHGSAIEISAELAAKLQAHRGPPQRY